MVATLVARLVTSKRFPRTESNKENKMGLGLLFSLMVIMFAILDLGD